MLRRECEENSLPFKLERGAVGAGAQPPEQEQRTRQVERQEGTLRIAYINIQGGVARKKDQIADVMKKLSIGVLAMTETMIGKDEVVVIGDRQVENKHRTGERRHGGIGCISTTGIRMANLDAEAVQHEEEEELDSEWQWWGIKTGTLKLALGIVYIQGDMQTRTRLLEKVGRQAAEFEGAAWQVILVGDFNGHVGDLVPGNSPTVNREGQLCKDFFRRSDMVVMNADRRCRGTWTRMQGNSRSVLDFILVSQTLNRQIETMVIDDVGEFLIESDHNLMWLDIAVDQGDQQEGLAHNTGWKMTHRTNWTRYRNMLEERAATLQLNEQDQMGIANVRNRVDQVERAVRRIEDTCIRVAEETIGRRQVSRNTEPKYSRDTQAKIKTHKAANKAYKEAMKQNAPEEERVMKWQELQRKKSAAREAKQEEMRKRQEDRIAQVDNRTPAGIQNLWKYVQHKTPKYLETPTVKKDGGQGERLFRKEDIRQELESHVQGLNTPHPPKYGPQPADHGHQIDDAKERGDKLAERIRMDELVKAIAKMRNGKATGVDEIPAEFIKHSGPNFRNKLLEIFNMVRQAEYTPKSWRDSRMRMIPKSGDKENLNNYRGIAVNSIVGKLFTRIMTARVEKDVEQRNVLGRTQHGFRKGWRGTDAIFTLLHIIEKYDRGMAKLALAFLDLRKAYDRVSRMELWRTLAQQGYGGKWLKIVQSMYQDLHAQVVLGDITTKEVQLQEGVKQGCPMSPILFAIYVAELGSRMEQSGMGALLGEGRVPAIFFADDMVIVGGSAAELQDLLDIVADYGEEKRMSFNDKKSQVLKNWESGTPLTWKVGREVIQEGQEQDIEIGETEDYKYLGVTIDMSRKATKRQMEKAVKKASQMTGRIKATVQGGLAKTLIGSELWEKQAIPSILFGAEILQFTKKNMDDIEVAQNRMARELLGASPQVAVEALRGELGWWPTAHRVARTQLSYLGHLIRLDDDKWAKMALLEQMDNEQFSWMSRIKDLADKYEVDLEQQGGTEQTWKDKVMNKVKKKMVEEWRAGMDGKSSLSLYRAKERPKYEAYLRGDAGSQLLFQARTGDLPLNARQHRWMPGLGQECEVCETGERETTQHFMAECQAYGDDRQQAINDLWDIWEDDSRNLWRDGSPEERTQLVLGLRGEFKERHWTVVRSLLKRMWDTRSRRRGVGVQQPVEDNEDEDDWQGIVAAA